MNGCECAIYKILLDVVSNDLVAWAFITLARAYKYAGFLAELSTHIILSAGTGVPAFLL